MYVDRWSGLRRSEHGNEQSNVCLLCRICVGENSHVASGEPQFADDVSVANNHHQARCQKEDNGLVDGEDEAVFLVDAVVDRDGLHAVSERQRICSLRANETIGSVMSTAHQYLVDHHSSWFTQARTRVSLQSTIGIYMLSYLEEQLSFCMSVSLLSSCCSYISLCMYMPSGYRYSPILQKLNLNYKAIGIKAARSSSLV